MLASDEDVEHGRALRRRPACHPVEAALVTGAELARPFGDVQDNRSGRSVELILQVRATPWRRFDDPIDEVEELDGPLVDVQLLVIERHAPLVAAPVPVVVPKTGHGHGHGHVYGRIGTTGRTSAGRY